MTKAKHTLEWDFIWQLYSHLRGSLPRGVLLLTILQKLKVINCDGVFLVTVWAKACNFISKRLYHKCFPVNFAKFFQDSCFYFENGCFPDDPKRLQDGSIFKKNEDLDKENYAPVSVLSYVSRLFKRIMHDQIDAIMKTKLSSL